MSLKALRICGRMRWVAVLFALVSIGSFSTLGQSPILDFELDPQMVAVPLGGSSSVTLRVSNPSVYEADEIDVELVDGPIVLGEIEPIAIVSPFSDETLEIPFTLSDDAIVGETSVALQVIYTYCIQDLCYQIVDDLSLSIQVVAGGVSPIEDNGGTPIAESGQGWTKLWPILFPVGLGVALAASLIAGRLAGRRWWVIGLLIVVMACALAYGLSMNQDQQAQSIGAVLCTSCVGIEETPHSEPVVSAEAREHIQALASPIELWVFTAEWCHACPYAKALVDQIVTLNPLLSYRLIDVDESRDIADRYGIVQSERTIVPAILRVDTGQVLFGIDHLEDRLVDLLEATP